MRKVIYLCVAVVSLALFSGQAYAQRYLPGMMGVELRGGFAGGSKGPLNYYTGFAVSGGRLLPEVPVRPLKDIVPFHRRFSPYRI